LGYDPKIGNCRQNIERLIKRNKINVDHFESVIKFKFSKIRYEDKDNLQYLVSKSNTFKNVLIELDLLPIERNYNTLKKYLNFYEIDYSHISLNNKRNRANSVNYDENILREYILESNSISEVLRKFGLSNGTANYKRIKRYINDFNIDISHLGNKNRSFDYLHNFNKIPINEILVENSTYNTTSTLKERLYKEGLKERKCELCGQTEEWCGKHMSLILDHKNGIYNDNREENLRIVCPNCNATLPTHCRDNYKIPCK
jgi:hypothetical protein